MAANPWVGKTLGGRYRLDELLGQGGMSAVYRAMDPNLRREVAVKLIHSHLSNQPEFVRRFEEEAAAVAQLRHPNIIQVYDFNHDNGVYYMVLEFVPGESLEGRLNRLAEAQQWLPFPDLLRYAAQVCDAMDYAHRRGMIHRDIKPANIMLNPNDQAILMDFGIAKIVGGQQHTVTGAVVGTALYMSPEQILGTPVDGRSDIYALGATLFEMVSGAPPFEADSSMSLMIMHLNNPPPDLRQFRPETPEGLVQIIEKSLAKDPADRFQSAAEMANALRREAAALNSPPVGAVPADLVQVYQPTLRQSTSTGPQGGRPQASPSARSGMASGRASLNGDLATRAGAPVMAASLAGPAASGAAMPPARPAAGSSPVGSLSQAGVPGRRNWAFAGGCAAALALMVCLLAGAGLAYNQGWLGQRGAIPARYAATQTAILETRTALDLTLSQPTQTSLPPAPATPATSANPVVLPGATEPGATSATQAPAPASGPSVVIVRVTQDGNTLVVTYETVGYIESPTGRHIHFFFNNVTQDQAGIPGQGPWLMYSGPRPFRDALVSDIPPGVTQICALVANPDHSVLPGSGNCMDLPKP